MLNENHANLLFAFSTIALLLTSIRHSECISDDIHASEAFYFGPNIGIILTCLFSNICLGIFGLFIVGNLCDFIQQMALNLIGARQKLRILAILVSVSFVFYSASTFISLAANPNLSKKSTRLLSIGLLVMLFQVLELVSIKILHPDVFGLKWISEVREYDRGEKLRVFYL